MSGFIDSVVQGQQVIFQSTFTNADTTAFIVSQPVSWVIRDPNNNMVTQGFASQDSNNPALWTATVNIPESIPITDIGERCYIVWNALGVIPTGATVASVQEQTSYFTVNAAIDIDFFELDRLQLEQTPLIDSIALAPGSVVTLLELTLQDSLGNIIFDSGSLSGSAIPQAVNVDGQVVYTYTGTTPVMDMTVADNGALPFLINWQYTNNGVTETEFHFLYVVNPIMMMMVNTVRRTIDKARAQNPNPALQYTDIDLVEYINQGLAFINGSKPLMTFFNISTLPTPFYSALQQAAAYFALSAQYLAEGQAAFDFNGQTVTLAVDRTQYTDAALGRFYSYLEEQLPSTKRMWNRSSGGTGQPVGSLGINFGPSTGFLGIGSRYNFYYQMLISGGIY